jgi:hypothetical protein
MNSLQTITDAWGNWYSAQNGTTCYFTASTDFSQHSELNNYMQYQTAAVLQSITYDSATPPVSGSEVAYSLWYNNGTSVGQQEIFQYSDTTSDTISWSVTESLQIGVELSATVGVPGTFSGSAKVTTTMSLSSTQGSQQTETNTWTVSTPVNVPANTSVQASMVLSTDTFNSNYTASVLLENYVAIWNNDRVNGHYLWFIPITQVFSDCVQNSIIDTTGYIIANGVLTQATGVITGNLSVGVGVTVTQSPLGSSQLKPDIEKRVTAPHLLRFSA